MSPGVAAGLEQQRLFQRKLAFVFQPKREPWRFDFLAKVDARVAAERNFAEGLPGPCPQPP